MKTVQTGDIVIVDFPGAQGIKRCPALVLSTALYHQYRPDVIIGVITSQVQNATLPTDYILKDWSAAGLHQPSAFRAFLATLPAATTTRIGHCSAEDWRGIVTCLQKALPLSES